MERLSIENRYTFGIINSMVYLLFGPQRAMIKAKIKLLTSEHISEPDAFNVVEFEGRKTIVQEIVAEASFQPFGGGEKVVILDDAYFLEAKPGRESIENQQDYQSLVDLIKSDEQEVVLIISVNAATLGKKHPVYLALKDKAKIFELKDITPDAWPVYVAKTFEKRNVKIDRDAIKELIARINNDALLFINEVDKLAVYTNHVTLKDVETLVPRPLESRAYALTNALIAKDLAACLTIYDDFLTRSQEPISLISTIANQFRMYSQVFILSQQRYTPSQIASELKMHEYPVKLALGQQRNLTIRTANDILLKLADLDYQIKSGQVDRLQVFELFLIDYCMQ